MEAQIIMSNKRAKERLIQLYGAECFIEKLHLRHDTTPRHYTSKSQMKKMKQLTFHHIVEKRNGGTSTVANGALLSLENHMWFNKQSPRKQKAMNEKFQKYKKCKVTFEDNITPSFQVNVTQITPTEREVIIEPPINVYEGMTQEEIQLYKEHKRKRNERVLKKFERDE